MQLETEPLTDAETLPTEIALEFAVAEKPVVLVTGCTGLIGSRLVAALAPHYRIVGLDLKPPALELEEVEWIECDFTQETSVNYALRAVLEKYGENLTSVIHLAAHQDFSGTSSPLPFDFMVGGTRYLMRGLERFQVEQFVFSSTLLVMKPVEDETATITENSLVEPATEDWDYPRSTLETERVIRKECSSIPTVILRIAGVYDQEGHSFPLAHHISRIYEKRLESYFFPGDEDHGQAFVHLDDLVDCFLRVIELRRELGLHEVFLIAEPDVMSYAELQEQLGTLLHGAEWPTIHIPKVVAKAGAWVEEKILGQENFIKPWMIELTDTHYPVEIERARHRLGWKPQHRLRDTLSKIAGSLIENPQHWYEINGLTKPKEKTEIKLEEK
jgi:nucleoside-diphosphate-sugar epimerase